MQLRARQTRERSGVHSQLLRLSVICVQQQKWPWHWVESTVPEGHVELLSKGSLKGAVSEFCEGATTTKNVLFQAKPNETRIFSPACLQF